MSDFDRAAEIEANTPITAGSSIGVASACVFCGARAGAPCSPHDKRCDPRRLGLCDTTLTKRSAKTCDCPTYEGNWGPCKTFTEGLNGRCVYCDHVEACHQT